MEGGGEEGLFTTAAGGKVGDTSVKSSVGSGNRAAEARVDSYGSTFRGTEVRGKIEPFQIHNHPASRSKTIVPARAILRRDFMKCAKYFRRQLRR